MLPTRISVMQRVEEALVAEFPTIVRSEVRQALFIASGELQERVVPQALADMLYVLVRHRLHQRVRAEAEVCRSAS